MSIDDELIRHARQDAGDQSMRAAGRTFWNDEDLRAACDAVYTLCMRDPEYAAAQVAKNAEKVARMEEDNARKRLNYGSKSAHYLKSRIADALVWVALVPLAVQVVQLVYLCFRPVEYRREQMDNCLPWFLAFIFALYFALCWKGKLDGGIYEGVGIFTRTYKTPETNWKVIRAWEWEQDEKERLLESGLTNEQATDKARNYINRIHAGKINIHDNIIISFLVKVLLNLVKASIGFAVVTGIMIGGIWTLNAIGEYSRTQPGYWPIMLFCVIAAACYYRFVIRSK